ncbi:MAG: response regulator transcription factor, partial [Bacteroidetes bacterium]|nr:response regulator transcription factor [Bacteroidota bacterium]
MKKIKIAIADDHPMVINGLKDMLATQANILIEATYLNGADLLKGLALSEPDVLLLDIRMPGESGIELVPYILKQYPRVRILILTNFDNTLYVHTLLNAGVQGYLLKNTDQNTLVEAIQHIH